MTKRNTHPDNVIHIKDYLQVHIEDASDQSMSNHLVVAAHDLYPNQDGSIYNAVAITITPRLIQGLGAAALDMNKARLDEGVFHLPEGVTVQALSLRSVPDQPFQLQVPADHCLEEYLLDHSLTEHTPEEAFDCAVHISPQGQIHIRFHHSLLNEVEGHTEPTIESAVFDLTDLVPVVESDSSLI